jgi:hypothetical protein
LLHNHKYGNCSAYLLKNATFHNITLIVKKLPRKQAKPTPPGKSGIITQFYQKNLALSTNTHYITIIRVFLPMGDVAGWTIHNQTRGYLRG